MLVKNPEKIQPPCPFSGLYIYMEKVGGKISY